jgi:hypothetical protein
MFNLGKLGGFFGKKGKKPQTEAPSGQMDGPGPVKPDGRFPNVLMAPPGPPMPSGTDLTPQARPMEGTMEEQQLARQQEVMNQDLMNPVAPQKTPVQNTQGRIDSIINKDYSIEKDDQGNVIHRGKDRDKEWSIKDKIGSFFMGMFDGTGAIPAATDRNYMEKREDRMELGRLVPQAKQQQDAEDFQRDQQYKQTQIDLAPVKVDQVQQRIDNTAEDKQRSHELKTRTQNWRESDKVEYYRLEKEKLEALKANRSDLYELAVRRQTEIERSNKVKEGQGQQRIDNTNTNQVANREQRRQQFISNFNVKLEQDAKKGILNKAKLQKDLAKDLANGKMDRETYDAILGNLNRIP